jgi:hypothetical protein
MLAAFPKTDEARVPGKQVLRSGTSVGANYHEAHRARLKATKCGIPHREKESVHFIISDNGPRRRRFQYCGPTPPHAWTVLSRNLILT